ncbi:hypothetical protein CEXT_696961 [Caerostris extrusa]|uniref:Uncharacterized protein n=1 Tax=Caerostris extrusa TaxID=172846 RepID=A0AAV4SGY9_CAEEX|nr:hypothetical protein CEXT_696961 [Caerostris extrusa]
MKCLEYMKGKKVCELKSMPGENVIVKNQTKKAKKRSFGHKPFYEKNWYEKIKRLCHLRGKNRLEERQIILKIAGSMKLKKVEAPARGNAREPDKHISHL